MRLSSLLRLSVLRYQGWQPRDPAARMDLRLRECEEYLLREDVRGYVMLYASAASPYPRPSEGRQDAGA